MCFKSLQYKNHLCSNWIQYSERKMCSCLWNYLCVGGGGCRRCWCSDSGPRPLVWDLGSGGLTGSGWGWLDVSDSGPDTAGCGEMASGFSPSGSRWCWCACLKQEEKDKKLNVGLYCFVFVWHVVQLCSNVKHWKFSEWKWQFKPTTHSHMHR